MNRTYSNSEKLFNKFYAKHKNHSFMPITTLTLDANNRKIINDDQIGRFVFQTI